MLVPRSLICGVSDAVSARAVPRNGGASVSGADRMHGVSEIPSSSFTLRQLYVAASCLDAGKCCVAESSVNAGAAVAEFMRE